MEIVSIQIFKYDTKIYEIINERISLKHPRKTGKSIPYYRENLQLFLRPGSTLLTEMFVFSYP